MNRGIDGVIENSLHDLFNKFFNIVKALCYLFAILKKWGILANDSYTQNAGGKDVVN